MYNQNGFSLTEALISLLIISLVAIALLEQKFLLIKLLNSNLLKQEASLLINNNSELFLAHLPFRRGKKSLKFKAQRTNQDVFLQSRIAPQVYIITRRLHRL